MEDILNRKIKIYKHRCTSYWEQKFLLDRVPSGWEVEKIEEKKVLLAKHLKQESQSKAFVYMGSDCCIAT